MLEIRTEDFLDATDRMPGIKRELLEQALHKPARKFLQLDGWRVGDDPADIRMMPPDADGHAITAFERWDLRASPEELIVRVQIVPDADPADVLRMLRKMTAHLEKTCQ